MAGWVCNTDETHFEGTAVYTTWADVIAVGTAATVVGDAVLLVLLTMVIPFAILTVGTPLALVVRLVVEILRRMF